MAFRFDFALDGAVPVPSAAPKQNCVVSATATLEVVSVLDGLPASNVDGTVTLVPCVDGRVALRCVNQQADRVSGVNLDVVPGLYEGGAKLWECTYDVITWLADNETQVCGRSILDLGCGTGLLGCAALTMGARRVCFQDLNAAVLRSCTLPNARLNAGGRDLGDCVLAVAAPWSVLETALVDEGKASSSAAATAVPPTAQARLVAHGLEWLAGGVDLLVASEILYNPSYYLALCGVMVRALAGGGRAIIGSKRHYFGVGGSTAEFATFASQRGLTVTTLHSISDGHSIVRDILEVVCAPSASARR